GSAELHGRVLAKLIGRSDGYEGRATDGGTGLGNGGDSHGNGLPVGIRGNGFGRLKNSAGTDGADGGVAASDAVHLPGDGLIGGALHCRGERFCAESLDDGGSGRNDEADGYGDACASGNERIGGGRGGDGDLRIRGEGGGRVISPRGINCAVGRASNDGPGDGLIRAIEHRGAEKIRAIHGNGRGSLGDVHSERRTRIAAARSESAEQRGEKENPEDATAHRFRSRKNENCKKPRI